VKKTELKAFSRPLGRGIIALGLDEGDELIGVARTKATDQVVLSTRQGMAIRFDESDVRAMGRPAYGVKGISLADDDEVIGMVVANGEDDPASLLTVCALGFGKRTALTEYRSQKRGGKGLIDIKTTDRNGPVVAIAKIVDGDEVMLTTTGGILIRTPVIDMRLIGRNTQGVRLIRVEEGDSVSSLAKLPEEELAANEVLGADAIPVDLAEVGDHPPHILDDGVGEAEAKDHIDDPSTNGDLGD
jgi:DNA gyrase subunit A